MSARIRGLVPRVIGAGLVVAGVGWLMRLMPADTPGRRWWPWLLLFGVVVFASPLLVWLVRRSGSAGRVRRWSRRSRRNDGVASAWTILRVASWLAMRRKATVLRPSLRQLGFFRRLLVSTRAYATRIARVGLLGVWSSVEDVTLRLGGPRMGKSGEMACRILDAPGAVIATSTRTDLMELTRGLRSQVGPVEVFNPSGLGGVESTVRFDPLDGCENPPTAAARAADLLSAVTAPGSQKEREFWAGQARRVLASLMHAAALGDGSMRDVLAWVADPDGAAAEVQRLLRRSPEPAYEQDALQFLGTNINTRSSICATIMPALGWLTDATAAATAELSPGEPSFDVADLLARRGTVYMLGAEDAQVAPLVTAFTGHIAREARRLSAEQPGGRLDPPLTLVLDEAYLICPVPLDNWTSDMGGRGVQIHIAVQSRAQLRQRWGQDGAAAIMNNAATVLVYGGTRDPDDLNAFATLAGERDEEIETLDPDGSVRSVSHRRVPVLAPSQIANLPERQVMIVRRGMPVAVGKVQMAWQRRDVRRYQRAAKRAAARVTVQAVQPRWLQLVTANQAAAHATKRGEGEVA